MVFVAWTDDRLMGHEKFVAWGDDIFLRCDHDAAPKATLSKIEHHAKTLARLLSLIAWHKGQLKAALSLTSSGTRQSVPPSALTESQAVSSSVRT